MVAVSVKNPVSTLGWKHNMQQLNMRFPQKDIDRLYFGSFALNATLPQEPKHLPLYLWSKIKNCSPTTQRRWWDIIWSCKIFHKEENEIWWLGQLLTSSGLPDSRCQRGTMRVKSPCELQYLLYLTLHYIWIVIKNAYRLHRLRSNLCNSYNRHVSS